MNDKETVQSVLHDFNSTSSSEEIKEPEEKALSILLIRHYKQV